MYSLTAACHTVCRRRPGLARTDGRTALRTSHFALTDTDALSTDTDTDVFKKATKPPSALGLPRPSTEWLLILPPDLSSNASDALRAARADDRLYDLLCLNRLERVINQLSVFSKYSR